MNKQTSTAKHKSRSDDPLWYFLAEYSFSEFTSDDVGDTLRDGLLFQTIRDLGVQPECLNKIEMTLIGCLKRAKAHFNQGEKVFPVVIGLFFRKKMIKSGNSARTASDLQVIHTTEPMQIIHLTGKKLFGGWGFFVIERARHFTAGSTVVPPNSINLFLYQEGD